MNINYWLSEYRRLAAGYVQQAAADAVPTDGAVLTWRDSNMVLPSYLDMHQWGKDEMWLDRFTQRAAQIIAMAADEGGYPGWPGSEVGNTIIYDMAIAGGLMRFANMVPGRVEAAQYRLIAEQVLEKWQGSWVWIDDYRGVYTRSTKSGPRSWPNNIQAIAGILHAEMRDTDTAQAIANTLRSVMRPHPVTPGAVIWNYADSLLDGEPVPANLRVDDINHAWPVLKLAKLTMPDMMPVLSKTVMAIWRGGADFAWRLDGTETPAPSNLPFYRHMEVVGKGLYDAVEAEYTQLVDPVRMQDAPGTYISIPSLVLLHCFPTKGNMVTVKRHGK